MGTPPLATRVLQQGTLTGDFVRGASRVLWPAASKLAAALFGAEGPVDPPLFVLGLPRSGTTLVMQTICHSLEVSFVPELARFLPFAPALSTWWVRKTRPRYHSTFESRYGSSPGWESPGEGVFWNLWLNRDCFYDDPSEIDVAAARAMVSTVGRVERLGGGPFVNKNLRNNSRVRLLAKLFPEARFVVVVRDPLAVAVSLLRGRMAVAGGVEAWFSIKPRGFESIKDASPAAQVAGQIAGVIKDLGEDANAVGPDRFALVTYEDFCGDPRRFIDDLLSFLSPRDRSFRRAKLPPASFLARGTEPTPRDTNVPEDLARTLSAALTEDPYDRLEGTWLAR